MIEATDDRSGQNHLINHLSDLYHIEKYETGWINRSDWTNVHIGSNTGLNVDSNVTHNLDGNLSELIVKVLISSDGTDGNSLETPLCCQYESGNQLGITIWAVDSNNIKVQTGSAGFRVVQDNGIQQSIDVENYYYKIIVYEVTK